MVWFPYDRDLDHERVKKSLLLLLAFKRNGCIIILTLISGLLKVFGIKPFSTK